MLEPGIHVREMVLHIWFAKDLQSAGPNFDNVTDMFLEPASASAGSTPTSGELSPLGN